MTPRDAMTATEQAEPTTAAGRALWTEDAGEHVYCSRCKRWLPIPADRPSRAALQEVRTLLRQTPPLWGDALHLIHRHLEDEEAALPPSAPPALDVEMLIWPLIESYGGRIEIDSVQRFREHLRAARLQEQDHD